MNKFLKVLILIVFGVVIETVGVVYYSNRYNANTYIDDVNVSGMTVQEVVEIIEEKQNSDTIKFNENGNLIKEVYYKDVQKNKEKNLKYLEEIEMLEEELSWAKSFFSKTKYNLEKELDEKKLKDMIVELNVDRIPPKNAEIVVENDEYDFKSEQRGNLLDVDSIVKSVNYNNLNNIELTTYYVEPSIKSDDENLKKFFGEINKRTTKDMTISFKGIEEVIPAKTLVKWLKIENDEMKISEEEIAEDLKFINQKHSAVLNGVDFDSTLQGRVHIASGTTGWYVDRFNTAKLIKEAILNYSDYKINAVIADDEEDFSDYVEVDLKNQKMFVYRNKEIVVETDIVSGRTGTETVPGYYRVWNMETPSVLEGYNPHRNEDYKVPVSYWIAFDDTGQGIHDASWQSSFGGDYHYDRGSLGCINTPPSIMGTVYEFVEVGMPVIVF